MRPARACDALACAHCPRPGRCCTGFVLHAGGRHAVDPAAGPDVAACERALALLRDQPCVDDVHRPLPFRALGIAPATTGDFAAGQWRYWCPKLGADGRCTDYARRPMLCEWHTPGVDSPCALTPPTEPPPPCPTP